MAWLAIAGMAMQGLGTIQAADAQKMAGQATRDSSYYTGSILDQQAGQTRASSQRKADQERLNATRAGSRVQAIAAANGGASDPSVLKIQSDIAGQGEYNALSALYTGEERARGLETEANLKRYEGDAAVAGAAMKSQAAMYSGFGTMMSSGGSLYSKYG